MVGRSREVEVFYEDQLKLCNTSPFFKNALNGHFMEAYTQVVHLPEIDRHVFSVFSVWMATGHLPVPEIHQKPEKIARKSPATESDWDLIISTAMIFAEIYMIGGFATALRNAFFNVHFPKVERNVDGALKYFHSFPAHTTLARIFDSVPRGATLAREIANAILIFFDGEVAFRVPFGMEEDIEHDVLANGTIYVEDEYGIIRVTAPRA